MAVSKQAFTAGLLIAGFAGLMVGSFGGCLAGYQVAQLKSPAAEKKVYSREEFRAAVMGKTPDEVMRLLGRPVRTSDNGDGAPTWYYENKSRDPVSGRLDPWIAVRFSGGMVESVDF